MRLELGEPFKDYGFVMQIRHDKTTNEIWIVTDGHDEEINITKELE